MGEAGPVPSAIEQQTVTRLVVSPSRGVWPHFDLGALCGPLVPNHRLLALPLWPLPADAPARALRLLVDALPPYCPQALAVSVSSSKPIKSYSTRPHALLSFFLHTHLFHPDSRSIYLTILLNSSPSSRSLASHQLQLQLQHLLNIALARPPSTHLDLRNHANDIRERHTFRHTVR